MEPGRIADQLRRSLHGDAWHGPSVMQLLEGVTEEQADVGPDRGVHSIRELILHLRAWVMAVDRMLDGEVVRLPDAEDWPTTDDDTSLAAHIDSLSADTEQLAVRIEGLPESFLSRQAPGGKYTFYGLLHGLVQHNLYHAGQIAILRKMPAEPGP